MGLPAGGSFGCVRCSSGSLWIASVTNTVGTEVMFSKDQLVDDDGDADLRRLDA